MIFLQGSLPPLVWDSEQGQVTIRFVNGEYETKNQEEIELLSKIGYVPSSDLGDSAQAEVSEDPPAEEFAPVRRRRK